MCIWFACLDEDKQFMGREKKKYEIRSVRLKQIVLSLFLSTSYESFPSIPSVGTLYKIYAA